MSPTDEAFAVQAPETAYSTPIDSPLNGPPPGRFRDGEVLTVQYRTRPTAVRRLLAPSKTCANGSTSSPTST